MAARLKILWMLVLALAAPALAASPEDLPAGPAGAVAGVIDADTLRLDAVDADIRLVGIQAPKLPLGRGGFATWPLAEEAKTALMSLTEGRHVRLRLPPASRDRNGRVLAHAIREDGLWIQGELLRQGWARVYSFPDNRVLTAEMYALEREARTAGRGIWGHPFYAPRDAVDVRSLTDDVGTFQIVTGTVADAARVGDRVYLNFGEDYRADFTASIGRAAWPLFAAAGIDPVSLAGKPVEVRGWIAFRNGPAIDVTHPEQMAILPAPP